MVYEIDSLTSAGNGLWNEDGLLLSKNIIGVIDGETPIRKIEYKGYNTLTEWMVDNFIEKFNKMDSSKKEYKKICRNIIDEFKKDSFISNLNVHDKPCFTSATVTFRSNEILCQVLCDSYIHIQKMDGDIIKITDSRHDLFSDKTVVAANESKIGSEERLSRQKLENRKMMNLKGGYWTVAFVGDFENEFIEEKFELKDVKRILICTDGFARLYEEFSLLSVEEILSGESSLDESLKILRDYENENYLNENYPCVKKSDDATAVLLQFSVD
jgi:serine/threonine protein phosphatase PrpC